MPDGDAAGLASRHNRQQQNVDKTTFVDNMMKLIRHLAAEKTKPKQEQRTPNAVANQIFGIRVHATF